MSFYEELAKKGVMFVKETNAWSWKKIEVQQEEQEEFDFDEEESEEEDQQLRKKKKIFSNTLAPAAWTFRSCNG